MYFSDEIEYSACVEEKPATKNDVENVRTEIKSVRTELKSVRAELKEDIKTLRDEMNVKFDAMDTKFDAKFDSFADEMRGTMAQYAKSVAEEMRSLVSIFDEKYNHVPKDLQGLNGRLEEHKKDPKAHAGITSAS